VAEEDPVELSPLWERVQLGDARASERVVGCPQRVLDEFVAVAGWACSVDEPALAIAADPEGARKKLEPLNRFAGPRPECGVVATE
jgi:hypothetical protein